MGITHTVAAANESLIDRFLGDLDPVEIMHVARCTPLTRRMDYFIGALNSTSQTGMYRGFEAPWR